MKAPSVREGSKENGTQVTGNRIYKGCLVCQLPLPDLAYWTIPVQTRCRNSTIYNQSYSLESCLLMI